MTKTYFNFETFYSHVQNRGHDAKPSAEWLTWFVGFVEAEGSFIVTRRGDVSLVVVQSSHNVSILYNIQKHLALGKVSVHSKISKSDRWAVQDELGLSLIISIFNGNMVLPSRQQRFKSFCFSYNTLVGKRRSKKHTVYEPVKAISSLAMPSLQDAWLAGFTDGEGSFYARMTLKSYVLSYSITQTHDINKPALENLRHLFQCGSIQAHSQPGAWTFATYGLKSNRHIINYFETYTLKTKKRRSFKIWCYIYKALSLKMALYNTWQNSSPRTVFSN